MTTSMPFAPAFSALPRSPFPFVLFLSVAIALAGCAAPTVPLPGEVPALASEDIDLRAPEAVLDRDRAAVLVNAYRRQHGAGPLVRDPALERLAQEHADAMAAANVLSHQLAAGGISTRLAAAGYEHRLGLENVAAGQRSLAAVIEAWRVSPGHDRALRDSGTTAMGLAFARAPGTSYGLFWCLIMTTPGRPEPVRVLVGATPGFRWGPPPPSWLWRR